MEKKVSGKSCLIFGIAALFYLYELALRVSPSVMTNDLMVTFNATSTMLGVLISFYYYAYTVLQLPCGIILDKMGARNLLGISSVLCILGSGLFAISDKIYIAQIGRFLVGAGSACAFISCLQIAANLFPKRYFVILAGITNMMGTLGGLFGGAPVAKAVNTFGWQNATYMLGAIGIVIAVLIFVLVPKDMGDAHLRQKTKPQISKSILNNISKLLRNPQVVLSGVIAGFMYLPIDAFAELWAVPFFMSKYGIGNETAALASAIIFVGVAIGSVAIAVLAKKIGSYMRTIRLAMLLTAIAFIPLIYTSCGLYVAFGIVLLIGFFTGAQPIGFTVAKESVSAEISGTTLAMTNCIVMLIGSIFQPFLGALLDFFWKGEIGEAAVRVYDIECYEKAILVIPVFLLISYVLSMFLKDTINTENE